MNNIYDVKLTEKPVVEGLKQEAYVVVTQKETVGNEEVEAVRRVPLGQFVQGLNETGMLYFPDAPNAPDKIYYASVESIPETAEEIEAMNSSVVCVFTIPEGRYFFACKTKPKTIKDKNGFDQSDSFESAMIGDYFAFFYEHTTVVPMKFTVSF